MSLSKIHAMPVLPWHMPAAEKKHFRVFLIPLVLGFVVLGLLIPRIPLPVEDLERIEELPPRLAKFVVRKPPPPPPPPKVEKKKPEPEVVKAEPEKPKPKKRDVKKPEKAKKVAKKRLKNVKNALASLRNNQALKSLKKASNKQLKSGGGKATTVARNTLSRNAAAGSGGIQVARASTSVAGEALGGLDATAVESTIGGADEITAEGNQIASNRTREEIRLVINRNYGKLKLIHNRALRKNPGLAGQMVIRIVIAPDGAVSKVELISSSLEDAAMERRILARVRSFNFGEKDVDVWDNTFTIEFTT